MAIKVAVIGAGSIGFTRTLFRDVLSVPELRDTVFAFTDINGRYLEMMRRLAERDLKANRLPARVTATTDRRRAVEGADYVINTARIGGLAALQCDIDIPLKYGVNQCVGDTLCAGGIMYGQRGIPKVLEFCEDIRRCAADGCLLLNYANPNVMNTWAALQYGGVRAVGLCHGVQHSHWQITEVIKLLVNGKRKAGDKRYVDITTKDVDIVCAGINHQTWFIKVLYDGRDWTGRLLDGFARHPEYKDSEKVRIDMLRRFGYFSTESNGHLSEYLPWYRKRASDMGKWIVKGSWMEAGGYLRMCQDQRNRFEADFRKLLAETPPPYTAETRSHEHGSHIIEALETGRVYRGHFNVVNNGAITNLPPDAIVEVPGYVDRNGISIPIVGDLPLGCAAVCNASISVQRLAVAAAVSGDDNLLRQAMMMDPLVGAVCDPPEIGRMVDELLVAEAKWLPHYAQPIVAARKRLAKAPGSRNNR